jgi:hypothetical protein
MAEGQAFEALQIFGDVPRKLPPFSNDAFFIEGGDDDESHESARSWLGAEKFQDCTIARFQDHRFAGLRLNSAIL